MITTARAGQLGKSGPLAKVRNGDLLRVDSERGLLETVVSAEEMAAREPEPVDLTGSRFGMGRELFDVFRANTAGAEQGAMSYLLPDQHYTEVPLPQERMHEHFMFLHAAAV